MVINNTDLATGFPRVSLSLSCHPEPLLHISATLDCAGAASTPMTLHGAAKIGEPLHGCMALTAHLGNI